MSLLAVTVGSDPSAVVDAVRTVGWYGVYVCHRLACSGGCYDAVSSIDAVDACCDTCGLRPVVEVSLYAQPGMVDCDVSACVEEGDVLVFEGDPSAAPLLFAVSRPMWERALASLGTDAVAAGLARVGDIVCGAAISVAASDDVESEALRLAESARLIAAASGGLP